MKVKEVIVVEGKDDVSAVKGAVEAEVIITNGFALAEETLRRIKLAQERQGVIIFTDPDYAGERIRQRISAAVPGCKHAFLPREEAILDDDIGIENASPASIQAALGRVREEAPRQTPEFTITDLARNSLLGSPKANYKRGIVGKYLGIGYTNGKQFLNRLNNYGITREEFISALGHLAQEETSEQGATYNG
ncbi:MAG: ribonuclease M5 [Clostridia bacterium]|nr:ribonuclease M5 [Clostridia bacterium]